MRLKMVRLDRVREEGGCGKGASLPLFFFLNSLRMHINSPLNFGRIHL